MDYPERADLLVQHRIALWDVMMHCERPGSLDSAISEASIETNPFHSFFKSHPKIRAILFNGSKAETTYRKRVLPTLPPRYTQLKMVRLPSTSPAMASLNRQQKLEQWRMALGRYGNTDSIHSG